MSSQGFACYNSFQMHLKIDNFVTSLIIFNKESEQQQNIQNNEHFNKDGLTI
jgi:hypothetical protein